MDERRGILKRASEKVEMNFGLQGTRRDSYVHKNLDKKEIYSKIHQKKEISRVRNFFSRKSKNMWNWFNMFYF